MRDSSTSLAGRTALIVFIAIIAATLVAVVLPGTKADAQRLRRGEEAKPEPEPAPTAPAKVRPGPDLSRQSQAEVDKKNVGCLSCHTTTDSLTMHTSQGVKASCTDCHGGGGDVVRNASDAPGSAGYEEAKNKAHILPKAKPVNGNAAYRVSGYAALNKESADYIRFINPGDLRIAQKTCGVNGCHGDETDNVQKSMMATGPMLWGAALYNNGQFPLKWARFGESYDETGKTQRVYTIPPPTPEQTATKGILPFLDPLPRFEIGQPGNILRVFERGGEKQLEIGVPELGEAPGKPANRLSQRGLGTLNRTDPVWLGLQRTRLLDPMLAFPGTNEQPGDYRGSGCSGCHVVYANDRDATHSGEWAQFGNRGHSATTDPTVDKTKQGHPVKHLMTNSIPSSQCVVCHHHPGTTVTQSYYGYTWWDNETDGSLMYPEKEKHLTPAQRAAIEKRNPEGSAVRGKWGDPEFLANLTDLNPKLTRTQFADFHGHGWVFRAVYKQDHKGNLLDRENKVVSHDDPDKFKKAVHLKDIHLEKGMHCVDCHFKQDNHGNGNLYGEVRAAVEITCVDCHGSIQERPTLKTTGPAAPPGGTDLSQLRTPFGQRRFQMQGDTLIQRSMVTKDLQWTVVQTMDTIDPASDWAVKNPAAAQRSRLAKTIRRDGKVWGDAVDKKSEATELAHSDSKMTCQTCHTSWVTSCFGCHLPMRANMRRDALHYEGDQQRNWTAYNFQALRDDVFMLGVDGSVMGHKISPTRSTCAVVVGSQNGNREWVYSQQQTISSEGFSGHAFSTFVPHTVRSTETKACSDCHVSGKNDNNAQMAQLLMQGTNFYNFVGRYAYVAEGKAGFEAVTVTEAEEPQAVLGSELHKFAYPEEYEKFVKGGRELREKDHHRGKDVIEVAWPFGRNEVRSLQLRGEYLYAATGSGGFRAFDVAQIDQKGFSEKMVSAPFSPFGQRLHVPTKFATAVASPTTLGVDPTRSHRPENQEQKIHLLYAFLYVTDLYEGLVIVGNKLDSPNRAGVATLLDGDPTNNFLERFATFNPDGILNGAVNITIAGNYAYIVADRGLVIVSIADPTKPQVVGVVGGPSIVKPTAVQVQFRYAFVTDSEGLKVIDVTYPERPRFVPDATLRMADARNVYLVRTYAYVAGGKDGVHIVDITRPEKPVLDQTFNAGGAMNDVNDVKVGMTNASLYAYVADGKNGMRVVQLTSTVETPNYLGFAPRPKPVLIATAKTHGPALALSKGTDRDRAVDESGNQLSVFNRVGGRPFNKAEMDRLYLKNGNLYVVNDEPPSQPREPAKKKEEAPAAPTGPSRPRRGGS